MHGSGNAAMCGRKMRLRAKPSARTLLQSAGVAVWPMHPCTHVDTGGGMANGARRFQHRIPAPVRRRVRAVQGRWGRATAPVRVLPDFLIIGGQRCGTTSLFKYLAEHPRVAVPPLGKGAHFFDTNFERGENWYRGHFPVRRLAREGGPIGRKLTGEGSPYYLFHPLAPQRVADLLPGVKLIAMLRNPVSRAYSHYWHEVARGFESMSFEEAVALEPERLAEAGARISTDHGYASFNHQHWSYLSRGLYADQLEAWYAHFPREQLMVISSEQFFAHPDEAYGEILDFLGLPLHQLSQYEAFNPHDYPPMREGLKRRLQHHFAGPNARLADLLDIDFGWPT